MIIEYHLVRVDKIDCAIQLVLRNKRKVIKGIHDLMFLNKMHICKLFRVMNILGHFITFISLKKKKWGEVRESRWKNIL